MDYKSFTKAVSNLSTPSPLLSKIEDVVKNQEATASDIAEVIRLDPVITSKILRLANSAYLGIPRTVSTLQNAIVLLGNKRVQSIVLASELLNALNFKPFQNISVERYWMHSVSVALIAENVARLGKSFSIDENEVFIGALLHDIGLLVIAQLEPSLISKANQKSTEEKVPFWAAEDKLICHTLVGESLAEHWAFPATLKAMIKDHHDIKENAESLLHVSIVHIADVTAHLIGCSIFMNENPPQVSSIALDTVALMPSEFRKIAENAVNDKKKVESLLELFKV